ncbi:MAG: SDR family NAD(P)-dependent oxidoreductase [Phocaeicola sp.]
MKNKIVLITGASAGIGEGCARKFAQEGARVILNARSVDKLETLKKELVAAYQADVYLLPFDVRDRMAMAEALAALPAAWSEIDVLVNNAGLVLGVDKEHEGSLDEYDVMIDTNIRALLAMTRCVVPGMVERNRGHVINIGSIAGDAAYPGGAVYCATKAAVKALSDGLRIDLVHTPLRVTNIKPGMVETNFSVVRFRGDKERADSVYKGIQPLTGDDIAETVYFAASLPSHIQIAELLVTPTNQATATIAHREL